MSNVRKILLTRGYARGGPTLPLAENIPAQGLKAALESNPETHLGFIGIALWVTASELFAVSETGEVEGLVGTRIITELATNRGIDARPVPVQVTLYNDIAASNLRRVSEDPTTTPMPGGVVRFWGQGPGGRFGRRGRDYLGHLVTVVDKKWLVDAAMVTASDPGLGLHVDPLVVKIDSKRFLTDLQPLEFTFGSGTAIKYEAMPTDKSYTTMKAWTDDFKHRFESVECQLEKVGVRTRRRR